MLKAIAKSRGEASTSNGIKIISEYLGTNDQKVSSFNIVDGSGLSRKNLVTTKGMVDFLRQNFDSETTNFSQLGLSVAGRSGSLKSLGRDKCFAGKLSAKSGYMENVRSYTGIYQNGEGENIIFCIILNNYNCSASRAKKDNFRYS